jgi:hypothetical protein
VREGLISSRRAHIFEKKRKPAVEIDSERKLKLAKVYEAAKEDSSGEESK